jgi:pantoate--beta-alanine ligase
MQVLATIPAMADACRIARAQAGATLGLVPTMGALHAGHLSLVARARATCSTVAVTIFVNPLQFAPHEDFDRSPKQLERDLALLAEAGADLVFTPSVAEMYPAGAATFVEVGELGERLDGAHRPGHFRGVTTVVAKLFHITQPQIAFFGQKDAVQLAVLRRMVHDLNFGIELVGCPIVRDADGLALSSRNAYLSSRERAAALAIPRALKVIEQRIAGGQREALALLNAGREVLGHERGIDPEYLEAVHPETLTAIEWIVPGTLIAIAARVGSTRLIDNVLAP